MDKRPAIIVACARNRVIGRGGRLPWSIPADWQHFLATTAGQICLLGRRSFEEMSTVGEVAGQRSYIVLTRDAALADPARRIWTAPDFTSGLEFAETLPGELWIAGGERVYREALPLAARLLLTEVDAEVEGDTWFPDWRGYPWHERSAVAGESGGYRYVIRDLWRK